ncbi:MAG: hypothetical protein ACFFCS_03780 [Candidatus Hodarchaeota archaeon]
MSEYQDDSSETEEMRTPRAKKQNKLLVFLNNNFGNIFSREHYLYTLTFFVAAIILAILQFFPTSVPLTVGLCISTSLLLTFVIMFVLSNLKGTEDYVIGRNLKKKALTLLILGLISVGLCVLFFLLSMDLPKLYRYDISLPWVFIIISFVWNAIQIFFIRKGLEDISLKIEKMSFNSGKDYEKKTSSANMFLVIGIIVPIVVQVLLLVYLFSNPGAILNNLIIDVFGQMILIGWIGGGSLVIALATFNIYIIHRMSIKHDTPSIFGPMLHMLFWVYILYRSYSFINSAGKTFAIQDIPLGDQIIDALIMVLSLLLLFRGLGKKLSRVSLMSKKNIPFLAYSFALIVIMGKVALLIGVQTGTSFEKVPQALLSTILALLDIGVAILFYFIYIKKIMMYHNYLERDTYSVHEVAGLFNEYTDIIIEDMPRLDGVGVKQAMKDFLVRKEIVHKRESGMETVQAEVEEESREEHELDETPVKQEPDDDDTG